MLSGLRGRGEACAASQGRRGSGAQPSRCEAGAVGCSKHTKHWLARTARTAARRSDHAPATAPALSFLPPPQLKLLFVDPASDLLNTAYNGLILLSDGAIVVKSMNRWERCRML